MSDADNLEIKKRARRRLVGAAALALLAAIILPMAMDQEPQVSTQDIQISIPERDAMVSQARPIASRPAEPEVAPAPVEEAPQTPVPASRPASPSAAEAKVAAAAPAMPPSAAAASTPPQKTEGVPPAVPPVTQPPANAATPKSADAEAERVKALLAGGAAPKAPVQAEALVIQVAAVSDAAKAAALAVELKKQGYNAYTEKAGAMTRVRVGPVATRAEADSMAARLKAMGHNAVVAAR